MATYITNALLFIVKSKLQEMMYQVLIIIKNNELLNLKIERDLKLIINWYNKGSKNNILNSIILLMKDIKKLF